MNNSILKNIDYARLEEIENIRASNLNDLPQNQNFIFLIQALKKTKIIPIALIILSIVLSLTKIEIVDVIVDFALIFAYPVYVYKLGEKYKIEYLTNGDQKLNAQLFLDSLKHAGLEVTDEEAETYHLFLERYINFYILKRYHELAPKPNYLFRKDYTTELSPEDLLISAFVFKTYSSLLKNGSIL